MVARRLATAQAQRVLLLLAVWHDHIPRWLHLANRNVARLWLPATTSGLAAPSLAVRRSRVANGGVGAWLHYLKPSQRVAAVAHRPNDDGRGRVALSQPLSVVSGQLAISLYLALTNRRALRTVGVNFSARTQLLR